MSEGPETIDLTHGATSDTGISNAELKILPMPRSVEVEAVFPSAYDAALDELNENVVAPEWELVSKDATNEQLIAQTRQEIVSSLQKTMSQDEAGGVGEGSEKILVRAEDIDMRADNEVQPEKAEIFSDERNHQTLIQALEYASVDNKSDHAVTPMLSLDHTATAAQQSTKLESGNKGSASEIFNDAFSFIKNKSGEIVNLAYSIEYKLDTAIWTLLKKGKGLASQTFNRAEEERKDARRRELVEKMGASLAVSENESMSVKEHLDHLSLLPDDFLTLMMEKGLRLRIGDKDIIGLSEDEYFSKNAPRAWKNKENWKGVAGAFNHREKMVYAGAGLSGSRSLVLHEFGHGVGSLLELTSDPVVTSTHERLYDKLSTYFQQGGPGGKAGIDEFVAESFAEFFVIPREKFTKRYDEDWYLYLDQIINQSNAT